jgi:hypothetical protein
VTSTGRTHAAIDTALPTGGKPLLDDVCGRIALQVADAQAGKCAEPVLGLVPARVAGEAEIARLDQIAFAGDSAGSPLIRALMRTRSCIAKWGVDAPIRARTSSSVTSWPDCRSSGFSDWLIEHEA